MLIYKKNVNITLNRFSFLIRHIVNHVLYINKGKTIEYLVIEMS